MLSYIRTSQVLAISQASSSAFISVTPRPYLGFFSSSTSAKSYQLLNQATKIHMQHNDTELWTNTTFKINFLFLLHWIFGFAYCTGLCKQRCWHYIHNGTIVMLVSHWSMITWTLPLNNKSEFLIKVNPILQFHWKLHNMRKLKLLMIFKIHIYSNRSLLWNVFLEYYCLRQW